MAKMINMHDAKTHLSRLADQVRSTGEPIIIAKAGTPWVQVSLVQSKKPELGCLKNELEDFDFEAFESLDDEVQAMFKTQLVD
ncbi:MAG: hypothetical protein RI933_1238 [Actinomycetota bacterium]|jgi:antitoxin (DNA-binding transcriptional repressor) of toxin-antitoxin stability system